MRSRKVRSSSRFTQNLAGRGHPSVGSLSRHAACNRIERGEKHTSRNSGGAGKPGRQAASFLLWSKRCLFPGEYSERFGTQPPRQKTQLRCKVWPAGYGFTNRGLVREEWQKSVPLCFSMERHCPWHALTRWPPERTGNSDEQVYFGGSRCHSLPFNMERPRVSLSVPRTGPLGMLPDPAPRHPCSL
jgi:hypothetical protein